MHPMNPFRRGRMPPVPAQATVDLLGKRIGGGGGWYTVTVRTAPGWHAPKTRIYTIEADSDNVAALEGLRRFEEEAKQVELPAIHLRH